VILIRELGYLIEKETNVSFYMSKVEIDKERSDTIAAEWIVIKFMM